MSPERRREMLHNQSLRDKYMRGHAETISREVNRMIERWGDEGEIDLLDFFAELTIYTSTSCLIGPKFREELDWEIVVALPRPRSAGTDACRFVDPAIWTSRASTAVIPPVKGSWRGCRRS